ncbi:hypothetical protein [Siphonobacter aquaeclarae]|uniref:Late embryogenesis abundant protein LEA-2 subgroup domain-containing protein n=1 Tax=Siphonobacter aquaeclarae TaxID=563176 RepID=A0A1G9T9G0_9BACT|nr:hypothetical protein [Siphonobacter aquaeclarae]SDM44276.1 hypothetical protein SAMN04488090_3468 [Siphonobacter aquaeclarae]
MKNKTLIILLIVAGVILLVWKKVKAVVGLEYALGLPGKFKIQNGAQGKELHFRLPVDVKNQRNTKLIYQGADIMVTSADNKPLGRIWDTNQIEIEPLNTTTVYLPVILSGQNTVNLLVLAAAAIASGWTKEQRSVVFNFSGDIKGEGFTIPITASVLIDPLGNFY